MVKFKINDQELEAEEGTTVLQAALKAGIKIPTLCYHEEVTAYGACRVCQVEMDLRGKPALQTSCVFPVSEGLEVRTDTEMVKRARKVIFELLLARCPESEAIKEMAAEYGVTETRIEMKTTENCLLCGLCIRACAEVSGRHAISFAHRGSQRSIQTAFGQIAEDCVGCQACAYMCPTGRIKIEEAD